MNSAKNKGCLAPGCDRPYHAKGYCSTHHKRLVRHGSLDLPKRTYELECKVDDCARSAFGRNGYCNPHGHRFRRYGDPLFDPRPDYQGVDMSLYNVWNSMRQRCTNPNVQCYPHYGGRGIRVCNGWRSSYKNFMTDMGSRPSPGLSLDRMDNDGHYSCGHCSDCKRNRFARNVKWSTRREQSHNSTAVHWLTVDGETHTLADWTVIKGLGKGTISDRLARGWSAEDAVNTPTARAQRFLYPRVRA